MVTLDKIRDKDKKLASEVIKQIFEAAKLQAGALDDTELFL